MRYKSIIWI